jgi:NAD(P)-dependent dehydrogenase (short-subunit alcohol dehydrogenase family)
MADSGRDLTSGVAVVTGGASGFGRAIGGRCAGHGFSVALLDIDGERAAAEASALATDHGVRSLGLGVDVGDAADVERAANTVAQQLGGADLVFSNVGVQQIGALERFSDEAWTWMLDVNVIGAARVARSFLPLLRRSDSPRLAFTASASVLTPASRLAAYQASKFAVLGLAETLRIELAADGITVSVIFPSGMMTRHLESSLAARPTAIPEAIAEADDIEALLASNPFISQLATAEDAARHAVGEVLAGEPYIVTHGDLLEAVTKQHDLLRQAAERARLRGQTGPARR